MQFGKERWVHAQGVNISETGLRARLDEEISPGTSIFVQLEVESLRDADPTVIAAEAIAIHVKPIEGEETVEVGFEFSTLSSASRAALRAFLDGSDQA